MKPWVFGIDGGGTSSRLRAESLEGEKLYEGIGGGTNPNSCRPEVVLAVLRGLLAGAFASGLEPASCRSGFLGSAGVDRPRDETAAADRLARAFREAAIPLVEPGGTPGSTSPASKGRAFEADPVLASGNDAESALVGALADVEGFLLIAGTGSIAYGRTKSGRRVRAGGWGHFLGDEGSAFWIAFQALKRGLRSAEGRDAPTGLLEKALEHFGLSAASDLIPFTYGDFDKARIASFAPRVLDAAEAGDALARSIVGQAAQELAGLVVSVYGRVAAEMDRKRIALYGGLLEGSPALKRAVAETLARDLPELEIVPAGGDAQTGACRLARELLDDTKGLY